jgi:hypothetical protein
MAWFRKTNEAKALIDRIDQSKPAYVPRRISIRTLRRYAENDEELVDAVHYAERSGFDVLGYLNYSEQQVERTRYQRTIRDTGG